MPRPREFDEEIVLKAAVQCFWSRGYEATSVRDLARDMGITSASLYNAFGDKRSLYRYVLKHYLDTSVRDRIARLEGQLPPPVAIRAFFDEIINRSLSDTERKGCLLVNSALEMAPHDPEFEAMISTILIELEGFFHRCCAAGQRAGTIDDSQTPEDLGRLFLGVLLGIRVLARVRPERSLFEGLLRPALAYLSGNDRQNRDIVSEAQRPRSH